MWQMNKDRDRSHLVDKIQIKMQIQIQIQKIQASLVAYEQGEGLVLPRQHCPTQKTLILMILYLYLSLCVS